MSLEQRTSACVLTRYSRTILALAILGAAAGISGCSDPAANEPPGSGSASDVPPETAGPADVGVDTGPAAVDVEDVSTPALGQPCASDADCGGAACLPDGSGASACSGPCAAHEECPLGWLCAPGPPGPGAGAYCQPAYLDQCRPCATSVDCPSAALGVACVPRGDDGSFCAAPCLVDCVSKGFACKAVHTAEGVTESLCVVASGGSCSCPPGAEGATTACAVTNEHGSCVGERTCGDAGLTDCSAPAPAAESCNGVDDDCDGAVDEPGAAGCTGYFLDVDEDGAGALGASSCRCAPGDGYTATVGGDCNDEAAAIHPAAQESCDTPVDDNCNQKLNEEGAEGCSPFYADLDADGYGSGDGQCLCVAKGSFTSALDNDCDDSKKSVNVDAVEICNGIDDDCNGGIDDVPGCGPCVPSCAGKACGPDGCGGDCGVCSAAKVCQEGQCVCDDVCQPTKPECLSLTTWHACLSDAAGCLVWGEPKACAEGQQCLPELGTCGCKPDCAAKSCGADGCGGSCGGCDGICSPEGQCVCEHECPVGALAKCGPNGQQQVCEEADTGCRVWVSAPCPEALTCVQGACTCLGSCANKSCGDDGCGGSCGVCTGGETCSGSGECVCTDACPLGGTQCDASGLLHCEKPAGQECASWVLTACPDDQECVGGSCVCVPDCDGKACGADGCEGSCGECGASAICDAGACVCVDEAPCESVGVTCSGPDRLICANLDADACLEAALQPCPAGSACSDGECECVPQCAGKVCGPDTCGGFCGACGPGKVCNAAGECLCPATCDPTTPPTCAGEAVQACQPDPATGCLELVTTACTPPQTCVGGICLCEPQCLGKECGPDGCGQLCGTCVAPKVCDPTGTCTCTDSCPVDAKSCADPTTRKLCQLAAGCLAWVEEPCPAQHACDAGECVCVPACSGKECGPDGCDGTCGVGCGPELVCDEPTGECVPDVATSVLLTVHVGAGSGVHGVQVKIAVPIPAVEPGPVVSYVGPLAGAFGSHDEADGALTVAALLAAGATSPGAPGITIEYVIAEGQIPDPGDFELLSSKVAGSVGESLDIPITLTVELK